MKSHRKAALREVVSKSEKTIEKETAEKWLDRACACYTKYTETKKKAWLLRAESYAHEALEHGSLAWDKGKTVAKIERALKRCGKS